MPPLSVIHSTELNNRHANYVTHVCMNINNVENGKEGQGQQNTYYVCV